MGVEYELCPLEVQSLIADCLREYHPQLKERGVTVQAIYAKSFDEDAQGPAPAIKRNDYPCAAKISITSTQDRALGLADVKLVIDFFVFAELPESKRRALVDHELAHVEEKFDRKGSPMEDSLGRPRLGIRPHDFELGFFEAVAKRHYEAAPEVVQAQLFVDRFGQYCMFGNVPGAQEVDRKTGEVRPGAGPPAPEDLYAVNGGERSNKPKRRRAPISPDPACGDDRDPAVVAAQEN